MASKVEPAWHDDKGVIEHFDRVHSAVFKTYKLSDVSPYIAQHTYLRGSRYSFKDHEFQQFVIDQEVRTLYCQKCAQVGLSEVLIRYAMAIGRVIPYFGTIMTWPSNDDAEGFVKTRINPLIAESPDLLENLNSELNNVAVKEYSNGSLIYFKGCNGDTAALSTPADLLIHDEVDRSDANKLGQYQSRLQHSEWGLTRAFGTPTVEGRGIASMMAASMRWRHLVKCHHCAHWFNPSFHDHVQIPGYEGEKKNINRYNIGKINWQAAVLLCPYCGKEPSLQPENRDWVCENTADNFLEKGIYITPFSVPNLPTTSMPSLVYDIIKHTSWGEFVNQRLGETSTEKDQDLDAEDLERAKYFSPLDSKDPHGLGIDVGQICHLVVGRITHDGTLLVVHKETALLSDMPARKAVLAAQYRVVVTVIDTYPETSLVKQMQDRDPNLFGAQYHTNRKVTEYKISMVEADAREGKVPVNQVLIHPYMNFDKLLYLFKSPAAKKVLWAMENNHTDDLFVSHCLDMKRVLEFDKVSKSMQYRWEKSSGGADHFFHALGYMHVACHLIPAANRQSSLGSFPIAMKLKIKLPNRQELEMYGRPARDLPKP